MLALHQSDSQSSVNSSSITAQSQVPLLLSFYSPSQGRGDGRILRIAYCLENGIGTGDWTGNVVISEVAALTYVVLSKAENHVPYEGNLLLPENV